ncbi:hypothetical protein HPY28_18445 [Brevibacillus sp. HB1.2]|uniref:hypothetical protein n=1 Tax=Brevibacillus TaxID=55080 RepID=UPI00037593F1|nr:MULTISPECIES: hypothetical protein [unclassified Brevibacillus]ATF14047.1 hypothetical protein A616_19330 [Brevibacillus brevis X23]NRS19132.1 hypothetical protein [Brevibacillus sp. HB1.4B]NTU22306.1 hypothetical protein [Brevibacillus sp. HB1.2]
MDKQQVYAAASIIESMYYRYQHTNWLHRQIRNQIIAQIYINLEVPLEEAKDIYRFAIENKIPRVWYALIERSEIIDFPSRELIPEAVRFISKDSLNEIIAKRLRLDEIEASEESED